MPKLLSINLSKSQLSRMKDRMRNAGLSAVDVHRRFKPRMSINSIRNKLQGVSNMSPDQLSEFMRIIREAEKENRQAKALITK